MKISDPEIRSLIFNNLELVKKLLLTRNDLSLLDFVQRNNEVRPPMVAEFKGANVNNASTKLKKLFEQGYLQRREVINDSGNVEYLNSLLEFFK